MKLKILFLVGVAALITLSFTFSNASLNQNERETLKTTATMVHDVGFISDEVIK